MNRSTRAPRGLSTWLAVAAVRAAPGESVARILVGVAAVLVTLVGLALQPSALARSDRAAENLLSVRPLESARTGIVLAQSADYYDGHPIAVRRAAVVGTEPATVAGMPVPAPGELVVSRAMRAAMESSSTLRARYPGTIVGTVPAGHLAGPGSFTIWSGTTRDSLGGDAGWLVERGGLGGSDLAGQLPGEVRFAVPMLVIGFLVPLVALQALLATLGGARREHRLAALRLIGLTDRTAKASAGVEAGLLAAVCVVLGLAAFLLLRGPAAANLPVDGGVWAADVRLPWQRAVNNIRCP